MDRSLEAALLTARRLREELPRQLQPDPQLYDLITLADTVNIMLGALQVIADPLAEVPKEACRTPEKLIDYYENLASGTLDIVYGRLSMEAEDGH